MRIISGKYKNKKIDLPKKIDFRPTKTKVKEAVFSIISSGKYIEGDKNILQNAVILELYAGSASYSFEALSRGAKEAIIMDIDQNNIEMILKNSRNIAIEEKITAIRTDASIMPKAKTKCDIVFIDPPYNKELVSKSLVSMAKNDWLSNNAIIIIESDMSEKFELPEKYNILEDRIYNNTRIKILEYINT